MSELEHLTTPRKRTSFDPYPEAVQPVMTRKAAAPIVWPGRARAVVGGLAMVVAVLCAVVTWLIVQRAATNTTRNHQIGQLACQVQRLGGLPVGGVHCPPKKRTPGSRSRTPYRSSPAAQPTVPAPQFSGVLVVPGPTPGRTTAPSRHRASQRPSPSPRRTSARPKSPSSSPTPLLCVLSRCVSPLPSPLGGLPWPGSVITTHVGITHGTTPHTGRPTAPVRGSALSAATALQRTAQVSIKEFWEALHRLVRVISTPISSWASPAGTRPTPGT